MEVIVLKDGVKKRELRDSIVYRKPCSSSVTLIKTNVDVIVDTGCRADTKLILDELRSRDVNPDEVDYVVNTH